MSFSKCVLLPLLALCIYLYNPVVTAKPAPKKWFLPANQFQIVANGAAFFGSGEGGSLRLEYDCIQLFLKHYRHRSILILKPSQLEGRDFLISLALWGSPDADKDLVEYRATTNAILAFFKKRSSKHPVLINFETGASNTIAPLFSGIMLKLPVVDLDTSGGRSISIASLNRLYSALGRYPAYLASSGPYKSAKIFQLNTSVETNRIEARLIALLDQHPYLARAAGTAWPLGFWSVVKKVPMHHGATWNSFLVGKAMAKGSLQQGYQGTLHLLDKLYHGHINILFRGHIILVHRKAHQLESGYIILQDRHDKTLAMKIIFLNENLLAETGRWVNGHFIKAKEVARFPELISYLLPKGIKKHRYFNSLTITNSDLFALSKTERKKITITVVGLPCDYLNTPAIKTAVKETLNKL